jgi:HlyD family secretion protein
MHEGQAATIRVDALPDKELVARVESIGTLAKVVFDGWPPVKQFEMRLRLTDADARLKSGMSAMASVATDRLERQILLPGRAVFQKAGRQVVYVRRGLGWDARAIVTGRRNADSVLVTSGLAEDDRVALRDPTQAAEQGSKR